jgi:hypothetical protein
MDQKDDALGDNAIEIATLHRRINQLQAEDNARREAHNQDVRNAYWRGRNAR